MNSGLPMNGLRTIVGGLCGVAATLPMSMWMAGLHRALPVPERYPLPPRQSVMTLARRFGLARKMGDPTRSAVTGVAHFAYGGAAGALYPVLADQVSLGAIPRGIVFGALIWVVSYLGLLPGTGLLSPAIQHPARRNALMIMAHLIWGVVLSELEQAA